MLPSVMVENEMNITFCTPTFHKLVLLNASALSRQRAHVREIRRVACHNLPRPAVGLGRVFSF